MTKNNPWNSIFRGIGAAISYGITLIALPLVIFYYIPANPYFVIEPEMKFWIIAMGMVVMAFAFGRASSPKRSVRRVIFNVFLTFANVFYIYSYWLSGVANIDLSDIAIPIPDLGDLILGIRLNLGRIMAVELGVIGLKFLIILYDLIDAIVYMSKRKTKIKISPGEAESDTFATYLEDGGQ
ncbi:MAG: hypothetical protein ACTSRE_03580 [Promethearchaeota archaeon]